MKIYSIGSVSIFVNVSNEQNNILDDVLLRKIALEFKNYLKQQIEQCDFDVDFQIEIDWKRGCIIETVTFGIIIVSAIKFLKDYDKLRNNLLKIIEDLKGAYLKIRGKKKDSSKFNKIRAEEIKITKDLPQQEKKYYESAKGIIYTETKITTTHKIAIIQSNLKKDVSEEEIKKLIEEHASNKQLDIRQK